jgi:cytochrome c oxidase subunit 1
MSTASEPDSTPTLSVATANPRPLWRRLIGFNLLSGIIGAIIGWLIGDAIGTAIHAPSLDYYSLGTGVSDIGVLLGYLFGVIGFLVGLGFLNYPVRRMLGHPPTLAEHEAEGEGVGRYFRLCTDHKVVGIQYLVAVIFFFFVAGMNAMFIRGELTSSNATFIDSGHYLTLVGLHGTMMLMMMSAGVLGPLGNYLVPLMIGARRMAFPRVEALTLWLTVLAGFVLLSAIFLGGFPTG